MGVTLLGSTVLGNMGTAPTMATIGHTNHPLLGAPTVATIGYTDHPLSTLGNGFRRTTMPVVWAMQGQ